MSAGTRPLTAQSLIGLCGLFAGLCVIFVLIVTVADAWNEHQQQNWPEAKAVLERCSLDPHILPNATRAQVWRIRCRIAYSAGPDQIETTIRSRSTRADWGGQIERMRQWVSEHRSGSLIMIHYDPQKPTTAVLTATDMPYAGPHTPDNLKLLMIALSVFLALSFLAKHLSRTPAAITNDANL